MLASVVNKEIVEMEELLHAVGLLLQRRTRKIARSCGTTPQQIEVLLTLKQSGPLTMGAVCKALDIACATGTDMMDRLEAEGLISRVRDPEDRRAIRIELTAPGEQLIKTFSAKNIEQLFLTFSKNSAQQNQAIIDALGQLKTALGI